MSDEDEDLKDSPQYADRDEPRDVPGTQENDEALEDESAPPVHSDGAEVKDGEPGADEKSDKD